MAFLGIEFNDSLLVASDGRHELFAEPGYAAIAEDRLVYGAQARQAAHSQRMVFHDRYWRDLSERRLPRAAASAETYADLAFAQLARLWQLCSTGVTEVGYAVPVYWSTEQLALLLGISDEVGVPVTALASIPLAATRRQYTGGELLHIDISAHATTVTPIAQQGSVALGRSEVLADLGTVALERSCAEYVAQCFLTDSRFDPLHAADSEQLVYTQLGTWLDLLNRQADAELTVHHKGNEFRARVSRAGLAQRLQQRMQPLIQALRTRLRADQPTALQLNARVADYPGFAEQLAGLPGASVFMLEPGAAARGLVQRQAHLPRTATSLSLCTSLPWDQPPASIAADHAPLAANGACPSHVVLGGRAWRLDKAQLRIGSEAAAGAYNLVIDPRHSGVSRQHCSIETRAGRVVLIDHSRFGTRLNGHPVQGSVVLQPGDIISVGDPVCELWLVAEEQPQ